MKAPVVSSKGVPIPSAAKAMSNTATRPRSFFASGSLRGVVNTRSIGLDILKECSTGYAGEMGRAGLVIAAMGLSACGAHPLDECARFSGDTCLVVRARGRDPVEQLELTSLSGFALVPNPARTPAQARAAFSLPALIPINLENFSGEFRLRITGLHNNK